MGTLTGYLQDAFDLLDMDEADALDRAAFAAYVEGLAASGWEGDPRLPRLGYAATCGVYNLLRQGTSAWLMRLITTDVAGQKAAEQRFNRSLGELLEWVAMQMRFSAERAREAEELSREIW